MKISRSSKIGFLIAATFIIFVWGFNFLKGRNLIVLEEYYYVHYKDIKGLQESAEVTINGYRIGQVRTIEFSNDLSGDLLVTIAFNEDFPLPKGTVARISSKDLMGSMIVKLELGDKDTYYQPNDTLVGATETSLIDIVGAELSPLKQKTEQVISRLDTTITAFNKVLNAENRKAFERSLKDLSEALASVNSITTELDIQKGNITGMVQNFKSISDSLSVVDWNQISTQAEQTLDDLSDVLNEAQNEDGTLGKFLKDSTLYSNLNTTVLQFDRFISNVEANPKKYLAFSAVDWGKDYYIISDRDKALNEEICFAVKLMESKVPISIDDERFKKIKNIKEMTWGKSHIYLENEIRTPDEAILRLEELRRQFPNAEIWAFRKGKRVKMKKAFRYLD